MAMAYFLFSNEINSANEFKSDFNEEGTSITGFIVDSELLFPPGNVIYEIIKLSNGKYYVIKRNEYNFPLQKGSEVSVHLQKNNYIYSETTIYEKYPKVLTASQIDVISIIADDKTNLRIIIEKPITIKGIK